ncbi:AraC family transcriptional regulator [uncultured Victivallis sp.]|uniref:AraC family transcriptional regulator n=1 Tax=uncultured Victivallis sp. TaxID=354118 RepID=UPI002595AE85|nr:AraC family transcriptional regulator [uncultured Victivallis sp.]
MDNFIFSYAGCDNQFNKTIEHSHRGWELLYIASGHCRMRFSQQDVPGEMVASSGDVFLIPPHLKHERINLERNQTFYVVFERESLTRRELWKVETAKDRLVRQWFEAFLELNTIYDPHQAASLIQTLLFRLEWLDSKSQKKMNVPVPVQKACDYMSGNLGHPIQISDVAKEASVSQSHLNLLFRIHLGVSPRQYLINIRMNLARRLLLNPYTHIGEVAQQCGFANLYYFTRSFTRMHHVSPGVYRRNPARYADSENLWNTDEEYRENV